MARKKNRVSIFGKTFHVTPAGKILPLGNKNNWFTRCMSEATKGRMARGRGTQSANRQAWRTALGQCAFGRAHVPGADPLRGGEYINP